MAENNQATTDQAENADQRFSIKRVYIKDMSFEAPASPDIFQGQYNPKIDFNLNCKNKLVKDSFYEVVLKLTTEAKQDEKTLFLAEVDQAGIFDIHGFDARQLEQALATLCPTILFPYAREAIDTMILKGTFPPLMLDPVNFEAIYVQSLQQKAAQQQEQLQ